MVFKRLFLTILIIVLVFLLMWSIAPISPILSLVSGVIASNVLVILFINCNELWR
jgi:hypothetical protein